ncbi:MAG: permease [Gemmatimonadetes bacterium]|nr:permease [Gemmatimonadota bacterium]
MSARTLPLWLRSLRPLFREGWFAAWVVLSLALSLGAVASVFSIADRLLLRPPAGIVEPERAGRIAARSISLSSGATFDQSAFSYPAFEAVRERGAGRLAVTAFTDPSRDEFVFGQAEGEARISLASGNYFAVLGARPSAGILFSDADDLPSSPPVVVLSEAFARRLSADPRAVLGRTIRLDGQFYTVVGLTGGGFTGTETTATDAWLPVRPAGEHAFGAKWTASSAVYPLTLLGRRAAGVDARVAAQIALAGLAAEQPSDGRSLRYLSASLDPLLAARGPTPSRQAMLTLWLAATALAMLLVASINVGSLYLARGQRRARDLAVRLALGATRWQIAKSLIGEALVLTAAGELLGLVLAHWAAAALRALVLPRAGSEGRLVDLRVACVTAALALFVAFATAIVPALRSSALDPSTCVRDAPAAHRAGGRTWRFALHTVQAALSAALLVATGLFLRSSILAQRLDLGFQPRSLYVVTPEYAPGTITPAALGQAVAQLRERVASAPGIAGAVAASGAPMVSSGLTLVYADGAPEDVGGMLEGPFLTAAGRDYLSVTGTRLLRGRGMDAAEQVGGALLNRSAASRLWPGKEALGRCLRLGSERAPCMPVVGVTEDVVRGAITDPPAFQVYVPLAAAPGMGTLLLVRASRDAADVPTLLRTPLAGAFPASVTPRIRSIEQVTEAQTALWRSGSALFLVLGGVMVLLAAVGLYGSLSLLATTRFYEFGVRIAFGARPLGIALGFVRFGVLVTGVGLLVGLALLRAGQHRLQPLLFETEVFQPGVIAVAFALLLAVSVLATAGPAVRAARTDPLALLRGRGA